MWPVIRLSILVVRPTTCRQKWGATSAPHSETQAYWVKIQVTGLPLWGGMRLPLEIGAVVLGASSERHTPLSGQTSPVRARVPIGFFILVSILHGEEIGRRLDHRIEICYDSICQLVRGISRASPYKGRARGHVHDPFVVRTIFSVSEHRVLRKRRSDLRLRRL